MDFFLLLLRLFIAEISNDNNDVDQIRELLYDDQ